MNRRRAVRSRCQISDVVNELYEEVAVDFVGADSVGTDTHLSSFLSASPSEAVVSSVSASAPVLEPPLSVTRLTVELVEVPAPITTVVARELSLES